MNANDIAHRRMGNLRLWGDPFDAPQDVVSWLCAVQSQDYGPAKWSIAQRTAGVGDADIDRAFADGAILRTHVLRPTWHFVAPADIKWMLQLTAPRVHALNAYMYRQLELDDAVLKKCNQLLVGALRGGIQLTRKELGAVLEGAGVATDGLRLAYVLMNAELNGIVCSGALQGKQHTYALLDERAPRAQELAREEALQALVLRYFTSHGPATAKDLKAWSSLTAADIREALEMLEPRLEHEVLDGVPYWFVPSAPPPTAPSPTVHLLQAYDEYIMGYRESKFILDVSGVTGSLPQGTVVFNHIVVLDGQVAGHWKRTLQKGSVTIEAALYEPFDDAQTKALQVAATWHGQFLGLTASVTTTHL